MNRRLLAGIAVPAAVVVVGGTVLLTGNHGSGSGSPSPTASASAPPNQIAGEAASPLPSAAHGRKSRRPKQNPGAALGNGFVGVAVNGPLGPAVSSFARTAGIHPALVELYGAFGAPFPQDLAGQVVGAGSTPFLQWNPRKAPLSQIAAGQYDGYIRSYARQIKSFGHAIVLSFAHEMNGNWYSWGRQSATPAQFIGAWRRIHTIFAHQHVSNVTWSWDPSHTGAPANPWWPGNAFVDRIGIDGYLRNGQTFAQIFQQQLANIRQVTNRPIFIAETSVAPGRGQGNQVASLFQGVSQYHLMGFVWFDINRLEPWRLEGRPVAIRAFRKSAAAWR